MSDAFPDRDVPLTDEQIAADREEVLFHAFYDDWGETEFYGFTCDDCPRGDYKRVCPFLHDGYNIFGECLAMK